MPRPLPPHVILRGLRTTISVLRSQGPRTALAYAAMLARRAIGAAPDSPERLPSDARRLVFVCHGNILRSALAEQLLRARLAGRAAAVDDVRSAGLHARPGRAADDRGIAIAPEFGASLVDHRARRLDDAIVREADAVIVMDWLNEANYRVRFPWALEKLHLLGSFDPVHRRSVEIPDPYMGDAETVRACYTDVARCVDALASRLTSP